MESLHRSVDIPVVGGTGSHFCWGFACCCLCRAAVLSVKYWLWPFRFIAAATHCCVGHLLGVCVYVCVNALIMLRWFRSHFVSGSGTHWFRSCLDSMTILKMKRRFYADYVVQQDTVITAGVLSCHIDSWRIVWSLRREVLSSPHHHFLLNIVYVCETCS